MVRVSLLVLLVTSFQFCERRTVVKLEGGNPPIFVLSGSGELGEVIIFGPEQEAKAQSDPFDDTYALWRIAAEKEGEDSAKAVEALGRITYGSVPSGYTQLKPETGDAPPLVPGKRYRYWFITINAPHASGYFQIHGNRATSVEGP